MKEVMVPTLEATEPKVSHLDLSIPGNKPIIVSVMKQEKSMPDQEDQDLHMLQVRDALRIRELDREGKAVNELNNFSKIDDSNKFSEGYFRCTGLIVAGIEKGTRKTISLLTHQDPMKILFSHKESFSKILESKLKEFYKRCEDKTVDAVIIGGHTGLGGYHKEQVDLLSDEVQKIFKFEPVIVNGPKDTTGGDDVTYDNDNRRVYFQRPEISPDARDFTRSDMEKH